MRHAEFRRRPVQPDGAVCGQFGALDRSQAVERLDQKGRRLRLRKGGLQPQDRAAEAQHRRADEAQFRETVDDDAAGFVVLNPRDDPLDQLGELLLRRVQDRLGVRHVAHLRRQQLDDLDAGQVQPVRVCDTNKFAAGLRKREVEASTRFVRLHPGQKKLERKGRLPRSRPAFDEIDMLRFQAALQDAVEALDPCGNPLRQHCPPS
ncbi:hypothetical protein RDV64_17545 [Acuticoccus sp. MNP-M23]|nr:hypothetical protein [Acuticoccus sp. MNP-M23]WMS41854.1 hypothetical protein RDV64_17545 [Acuticoccus sp. MNP-M23]